MRKRIINQKPQNVAPVDHGWLDLQSLAQVELTSEDAANPIEAALVSGAGLGWRAAQAEEQTICLLFDELQRVRRIQLLFHEDQQARTQEFVLRWSPDGGQSYREIVRQQYNFSPPGVTRESEDYAVDLAGVTTLELRIVPDISGAMPGHRLRSYASHNPLSCSSSLAGVVQDCTRTFLTFNEPPFHIFLEASAMELPRRPPG